MNARKRWKVATGESGNGFTVAHFGNLSLDGQDYFVVTDGMTSSDLCDTGSDAKTDATLAAAAPDLLQALKEIQDRADGIHSNHGIEALRENLQRISCEALEAISKAEGNPDDRA